MTKMCKFGPEPSVWSLISFFPPPNCDVEVDPEEDVDDKDCDEGLRPFGDASFSMQLQPDVTAKHHATA